MKKSIIICDRCKCEIKKSSRAFIKYVEHVDDTCGGSDFDLCLKCAGKFISFMKGDKST